MGIVTVGTSICTTICPTSGLAIDYHDCLSCKSVIDFIDSHVDCDFTYCPITDNWPGLNECMRCAIVNLVGCKSFKGDAGLVRSCINCDHAVAAYHPLIPDHVIWDCGVYEFAVEL